MSKSQSETTSDQLSWRDLVSSKLRVNLVEAWILAMLRLSPISPLFTYLAGLPVGPYKDKRKLLHYLHGRPYISPKAQIGCPRLEIGARCFIDDYVTIYAREDAQGGVYLADDVSIYRWSVVEIGRGAASVRIGPDTHIQSGCILNAFLGDIVIGANCMIAPRCSFMPYQHGYVDFHRPMRRQSLTSRGDVVIEDDVWLGLNVCVMDGVTIGKGAVVGAGAVVTESVPPYAIAGGVPARVIRYRGTEDPDLG
jgi:acetyltransferase-like isoleucine patch superfamily enzyme